MQGKYRQLLISTGLLVLFMNLTACGTIPKHISESDLPHDHWPIELYQPEDDLSFVRSKLNEGSPGLLTAVIDSARNSRAKDAYASVLAFAEDHSLNDVFLSRIRESDIFRQLSLNGEVTASDAFDSGGVDDGMIRVNAIIQLTHDLSTLLVTLEFKEYTPGAIGLTMNGIFQKYHYVHRLDGYDEEKSRTEFAEQWVELGEDRFIQIVDTGIDEVIGMMKTYLENPNPILRSEQEYYAEGYRLMSRGSRVWGGDEGVTWLVRGKAQSMFFAAPKEFIQEAD